VRKVRGRGNYWDKGRRKIKSGMSKVVSRGDRGNEVDGGRNYDTTGKGWGRIGGEKRESRSICTGGPEKKIPGEKKWPHKRRCVGGESVVRKNKEGKN